jgi:hypothetical protein
MESTIRAASLETIPDLLRPKQEYYVYDHLDFEEEQALPALGELLSNKALGRIWLIRQDIVPISYAGLTLVLPSQGFEDREHFRLLSKRL